MQDAVFVEVEDWQALYLDGQSVAQGNSIPLAHALSGRTVNFRHRCYLQSDEKYAEEHLVFPDTLDELTGGE